MAFKNSLKTACVLFTLFFLLGLTAAVAQPSSDKRLEPQPNVRSPVNELTPLPGTSEQAGRNDRQPPVKTPSLAPAEESPGNDPTQAQQPESEVMPTIATPGNRPVASNAERLVVQAMMRLLIKRGVFPTAPYEAFVAGESPRVSRAMFADIMVKALGHQDNDVSEFPVYRDVPLDYWAYKAIETAREREILQGNAYGYFYPERIISRQDAYLSIAKTLGGKNPTLSLANQLLSPFSDLDTVPVAIRPDIARLVNAQVIVPRPVPFNKLDVNARLSFAGLAAMLSRELEIKSNNRFVLPVDEKLLPQIPPGTELSVVPNGALYKTRLAVGDALYFSLAEPANVEVSGRLIELPRGTRLSGELGNILNEATGQGYQVVFNKLQVPSGTNYQVSGTVELHFDERQPNPFIVPGIPYPFTTTFAP